MSDGYENGSLVSPYWHITEVKLVNWGVFSGSNTIEFSWKGREKGSLTEIYGSSGTGKTTILDALVALLMKPGKPFNKASANSTGAKSRSIATYVKGMVGKYGEAGYERDRYLRGEDPPSDTWSMITATFMNAMGGTLSIGGVFWIPKGERTLGKSIWILADSELDERAMEAHAWHGITKGTVRQAYPYALVVTEVKEEMRREWHIRTGMTETAEELLYRILTSSHDSDVSTTFRTIVLDEPDTLDLASNIVEEFDRTIDNAERRRAEGARIQQLMEIEALYESYASVASTDAMFRSWSKAAPDKGDADALRKWYAEKALPISKEAADNAARAVDIGRDRLLRLESERDEAGKRYDELNTLYYERGGGRIAELEAKLSDSKARVEATRTRRRQLDLAFSKIEESVPTNCESWNARLNIAESDSMTLDERRAHADEAWADAREKVKAAESQVIALGSELKAAEATGTRIGDARMRARALLAEYSGLSESNLPFAAELMDLLPEEGIWRDAAHVRYGKLADTILVDKRLEFEFDRRVGRIQAAELKRRCNWRFVDTTKTYESEYSPGWLSAKMKLDATSPFASWLRAVISDEHHDAILRKSAEEFDDSDYPQITPTGQTKEKNRGAHGSSSEGFGNFIGFCDKSYLEELRASINEAETELAEVKAKVERYSKERSTIDAEAELINLLRATSWDAIDTATAELSVNLLEKQIEEARQADGFDAIEARRHAAKDRYETLLKECAEAGGLLNRAEVASAHAAERYAEITQEATAGYDFATVGAELARELEMRWDTIVGLQGSTDIVGNREKYRERLKAMGMDLHESAVRAQRAVTEKSRLVTQALERYKSSFGQPGTEVATFGTDAEDAVHYIAIPHEEDWETALAYDQSQAIWKMISHLAEFAQKTKLYEESVGKKVRAISDILSRFDYNDDGTRLHLIPRFDRTGAFGRFSADLTALIRDHFSTDDVKNYLALDAHERDSLLDEISRIVDCMRTGEGYSSANAFCVDPRRRFVVTVQARKPSGDSESLGSYGGKSGGEKEKTMAFVYGAAILYALGGSHDELPRFAPILLDEAFVRSDAKYTTQAIKALKGLGFQIILSCPDNKIATISPLAERTWGIRRDENWNVALIPDAMEGQC